MSARGAILVTGGAGYVGSHAAKALAADGRAVVVLDDLSGGHRAFVRWGPLVVGSASDEALVRETCRRHGVGAVLHFAGRTLVEESVSDPAGYRLANVETTRRLVGAVMAEGVRTFVFSSSAAVYGTPHVVPIPEDHPRAPTSPYGDSKAEAEDVLAASGIAYAALRYFNAAGAAWRDGLGESHAPETHLIPLALEAAAEGKPFTVHGSDWPTSDGTCVRDFVHVEDLADAHVAALKHLDAGGRGGAWNLGTGDGRSVRDVLTVVAAVVGRTIGVRAGPRRPGDPAVLVADASKARRDFGWTPTRSDLERVVTDAWTFRELERSRAVATRSRESRATPPPADDEGTSCAT